MRFWKSKGSSLSGFLGRLLGASLFLLVFASSAVAGSQHPEPRKEVTATLALQVTLVGIDSFNDFQQIRTALSQSEGVEKVSIDTEAPGVVTLSVKYEGEPRSLMEKLETFFPKKYTMVEKHLPSGLREIVISKKGL